MESLISSKRISDRAEKHIQGLPKDIRSRLMERAMPAIYIEDNLALVLSACTIEHENNKIFIEGKTLIQVISELRAIGVMAYLCSKSLAMYPAELLIDYTSHSFGEVGVDRSPKPLREMHTPGSLNIPLMREASISRDVFSVHTGGNSNKHRIEEGMLYTEELEDQTKCIFKYKAIKYLLYVSNTNFVPLEEMIAHDKDRSASANLLLRTSSIRNTDKI